MKMKNVMVLIALCGLALAMTGCATGGIKYQSVKTVGPDGKVVKQSRKTTDASLLMPLSTIDWAVGLPGRTLDTLFDCGVISCDGSVGAFVNEGQPMAVYVNPPVQTSQPLLVPPADQCNQFVTLNDVRGNPHTFKVPKGCAYEIRTDQNGVRYPFIITH